MFAPKDPSTNEVKTIRRSESFQKKEPSTSVKEETESALRTMGVNQREQSESSPSTTSEATANMISKQADDEHKGVSQRHHKEEKRQGMEITSEPGLDSRTVCQDSSKIKDQEHSLEPDQSFSMAQHRLFVSAIFEAGLKSCSPSVVLEMMRTKDPLLVTRERAKSHLQKYRKRKEKGISAFMTEYDEFMEKIETIENTYKGTDEELIPDKVYKSVLDGENSKAPVGGHAAALLAYSVKNECNIEEESPLVENQFILPSMNEAEEATKLGKSLICVKALMHFVVENIMKARRGEAVSSQKVDELFSILTKSSEPSPSQAAKGEKGHFPQKQGISPTIESSSRSIDHTKELSYEERQYEHQSQANKKDSSLDQQPQHASGPLPPYTTLSYQNHSLRMIPMEPSQPTYYHPQNVDYHYSHQSNAHLSAFGWQQHPNARNQQYFPPPQEARNYNLPPDGYRYPSYYYPTPHDHTRPPISDNTYYTSQTRKDMAPHKIQTSAIHQNQKSINTSSPSTYEDESQISWQASFDSSSYQHPQQKLSSEINVSPIRGSLQDLFWTGKYQQQKRSLEEEEERSMIVKRQKR